MNRARNLRDFSSFVTGPGRFATSQASRAAPRSSKASSLPAKLRDTYHTNPRPVNSPGCHTEASASRPAEAEKIVQITSILLRSQRGAITQVQLAPGKRRRIAGRGNLAPRLGHRRFHPWPVFQHLLPFNMSDVVKSRSTDKRRGASKHRLSAVPPLRQARCREADAAQRSPPLSETRPFQRRDLKAGFGGALQMLGLSHPPPRPHQHFREDQIPAGRARAPLAALQILRERGRCRSMRARKRRARRRSAES